MVALPRVGLQVVTFRDARGDVGRARYYYSVADITDATTMGNAAEACRAINAAIAACSNAAFIQASGFAAQDINPGLYGASGVVYQNVEDRLEMSVLAGAGTVQPLTPPFNTVRIGVPAPKLAEFAADRETMDPAGTEVAALFVLLHTLDATGGGVCDAAGQFISNEFFVGVLKRSKERKRRTRWSKTPDLTKPAP